VGGVVCAGDELSDVAGRWINGPFWPQALSSTTHAAAAAIPDLRVGPNAAPRIRFTITIQTL
jgi:hypothetical protein